MIVANYYWFYFEEYSALRYVFLHQFCGICKNVYYGSWELSGDPASINLTSNLMRVCLCVLRTTFLSHASGDRLLFLGRQ